MSGPGHSWVQVKPAGTFDAIVIGSGIGGLVTAALLAKHGRKRVLVLEQHYRVGGYTHTFTRPGYEWDVGVHYVGQVGEKQALRGFFDRLTDGRLRWAPLPEVYDRIELGERGYDLVAGTKNFLERMTAYFPAEADALSRYVSLVKSTAAQGAAASLSKGLPRALAAVADPLVAWRFGKLAQQTTAQVLDGLTRNEELKAVLTGQYGDYGLPPKRSSWAMHAGVVAHYLGGAFYPVGGSSTFASSLAPVIEAAGGHLATSARVEQVVVEQGRAVGVRLADGTELRAPLVISDAGLVNTLQHLLPEAIRPASWTAAVAGVTRSVSYFGLYLGFRHTDAQLGLTGTNLWLYPDHRHDVNVERFEADSSAPLPLVYLSFPSAKDPAWAQRFPGRATVDVITVAKFDDWGAWEGTRWQRRPEAYEARKAALTEALLRQVFRRLPQLEGKVDVVEASTPLSTAHFTGHTRGELYGLDHTPARYALPVRARTPIEGLLLTGADLASCGVAGAAVGGVVAASAVLGPQLIPLAMRGSQGP